MSVHIYRDLRGEWRWRLVAANGRIVADSAEGYLDRTNASEAVQRVAEAFTSGAATVTDE